MGKPKAKTTKTAKPPKLKPDKARLKSKAPAKVNPVKETGDTLAARAARMI